MRRVRRSPATSGADRPERDGDDRADAARRPAFVVAIFVAVAWAAVVFAADGILATVLGRDPVPPGESPYYGLLALAAAGVVVWLGVALGAASAGPVLVALVTGAVVYLLIVASGLVDGFGLVTVQAVSPFTAVAAVGAVVAVIATRIVLGLGARHAGR